MAKIGKSLKVIAKGAFLGAEKYNNGPLRKSLKVIVEGGFLVMIMVGIMSVAPSYGQGEPESWQIKTAMGSISQTDFVASLIVVNTSDDELTLVVSDSTRIMCGIEKETINELEIGDNVVVKYYDAGAAGLKAISIDDKNMGNAW